MLLIIMAWVATLGSIAGNVGVIYKKLWGMYIWTVAGLVWVIYSIIRADYAQLMMYLFYTGLNVWGIVQWSKKK